MSTASAPVVSHLARNIQTARTARRLTQQAFAEAVGVSRTTLCQWEADAPESRPNDVQIIRMGSALDVAPARLQYEEPEAFRRSFGAPPPRRGQDAPSDEDEAPPRRGRSKVTEAQRAEILVAVDHRHESLRRVAKDHDLTHSSVRRIVIEMRARAAQSPKSKVTVRGGR